MKVAARRRVLIRPASTIERPPAFSVHTPYAELDRQHELLRTRLAALQSAASSGAGVDGNELADQVIAVRSSLALHFNFEETVGLLSMLPGAYPTVQPQVERLREQHVAFLNVLDRIAVKLRAHHPVQEVGGALLAVLDQLVDHELDERQLYRVALRSGPVPARATGSDPRTRSQR